MFIKGDKLHRRGCRRVGSDVGPFVDPGRQRPPPARRRPVADAETTARLLGARDLTLAEATRIIGVRIGKPDLQYVQFPYADFAASLVQMGISENVAGLYAEMAQAFNERRMMVREGRQPENTTPTRFEDFVEALGRAYEVA